MADLRIGTSAFTAAGWPGSFYPEGMQPRDFLTYYATQFGTVEIDSTFYHPPPAKTVEGWRLKTPENVIIAAKVPQIITHEKCLRDCDDDFREFVETWRSWAIDSGQCSCSSLTSTKASSRPFCSPPSKGGRSAAKSGRIFSTTIKSADSRRGREANGTV